MGAQCLDPTIPFRILPDRIFILNLPNPTSEDFPLPKMSSLWSWKIINWESQWITAEWSRQIHQMKICEFFQLILFWCGRSNRLGLLKAGAHCERIWIRLKIFFNRARYLNENIVMASIPLFSLQQQAVIPIFLKFKIQETVH